MRFISLLLCSVLALSGCAVAKKTARHSGPGLSTLGIDSNEAGTATSTLPDGSVDYRARLFNDLNSQ